MLPVSHLVVSRHPSSPTYRELNFICPQFEQVHHCRSISVAQYSQRQVDGRGGAGAGADVETDADADIGCRCVVCAVREASPAFVFFLGGLFVRSMTAGLGPGCLGLTGTSNVVSLRSAPQASQHRKFCGLCRVHTEHTQKDSSSARGGAGLLLSSRLVLLLPAVEPLLPNTEAFPPPLMTFSAGDEVIYEPPELAISSS